jgi:urocanate hydratase
VQAGSFCYIGPQGIVHGTTLTLLNAGRKYAGVDTLRGRVFVTSGLGGMSGAQPKAAVICAAVCLVAEVSPDALNKRHAQGWLDEKYDTTEAAIERARRAQAAGEAVSIGYLGNVVDLWEAIADLPADCSFTVDLGSDQTSCHNPYGGGYYPVGLSYDEANDLMVSDPAKFRDAVDASLVRQVAAINKVAARGMQFYDYGNSFMLQAGRAGADIFDTSGKKFRFPSYVEDIMGAAAVGVLTGTP